MKNPVSKTITEIKPSGIRKFFDIVNTMDDAISLGVGEPDFDTPWRVRDEAIYSLEQGRTFYTSNAGLMELKVAISEYLDRKYDLHYNPKTEMMMTVGGSEAIDIGLRAMLDPGDEVIIPEPSYVSYVPCTVLAGGVPKIINLKESDEFRLTAQELEEAITDKTKVLILPYPNNPTGAIMEKEDLEAIMDHVSIASLPGMKERTVYINGFSKAFAMTGWRLGYACAPEVILKQMLKIHQFAIMCAPTTSQYAGIEAVKHCDREVEDMKMQYNERRVYVLQRLRGMGLTCFEPYGAFYAFPSIKSTGMTSDDFATTLLKTEKVAVVPGTAFGDCGEGFIRISYAYSMENLKIALDRIEKFLKGLS